MNDEKPWVTMISVVCDNEALRPGWREIEDQLRMIVARCGWDTRGVLHKLEEVRVKLKDVRDATVDMTLPPSKRFKRSVG